MATSVAPLAAAPAESSFLASDPADGRGLSSAPMTCRRNLVLLLVLSATCLAILGGVVGHHAEAGTEKAAAARRRPRIASNTETPKFVSVRPNGFKSAAFISALRPPPTLALDMFFGPAR
mmetsp:Transcript_47153/g.131171  ORF Transcript_47153/g.131171 Transcript_47153/m.131171 type:complete len:120 (+) Transcript_47153:1012-1371(+)